MDSTLGSNTTSLLETWQEVLRTSFQQLWQNIVVDFLPNFVVALIIFIFGWLVASVLGIWISRLVKSLQLDKALQNIGLDDLVARSGYRLNSGAFLGGLVKWFVIFAFLTASFNALGLSQVNDFVARVLNYLPNVFVASLVLILAAVFADILHKVIAGSARVVGSRSSQLFGGVAKWSIWILAIWIALGHLNIGKDVTGPLLGGLVTMLSIAGGLAFGLGGRDAAARYIEKLRDDIASRH